MIAAHATSSLNGIYFLGLVVMVVVWGAGTLYFWRNTMNGVYDTFDSQEEGCGENQKTLDQHTENELEQSSYGSKSRERSTIGVESVAAQIPTRTLRGDISRAWARFKQIINRKT